MKNPADIVNFPFVTRWRHWVGSGVLLLPVSLSHTHLLWLFHWAEARQTVSLQGGWISMSTNYAHLQPKNYKLTGFANYSMKHKGQTEMLSPHLDFYRHSRHMSFSFTKRSPCDTVPSTLSWRRTQSSDATVNDCWIERQLKLEWLISVFCFVFHFLIKDSD